jgi:hypothetical protein
MAWAVEKREEVQAAVDDLPEFHDPTSDISLFLAQKVKREIRERGSARKWSQAIQDDLLSKILPDFQNHFPHYRLGALAVKRTWERLSALVQQIGARDGAVTHEGKLDLPFFIRENLRHYKQIKTPAHPFHFAHGLAKKIAECLAMHDGLKLKLDPLARLIWNMQRHLLKGAIPKCPYDELDSSDKVIVKVILETTAAHPHIGHLELEERVHAEIEASGRFEKEQAAARIDNPTLSSEMIDRRAREACKRFEMAQETAPDELKRKVNLWSLQGDLVCRCIQIDPENLLLKRILEKRCDPTLAVHLIYGEMIAEYPALEKEGELLKQRIWSYTKYAWYTHFALPGESSLDRFIKWHLALSPALTAAELTELCDHVLPLLPKNN